MSTDTETPRSRAVAEYGEVWTTEELQRDFTVIQFSYGFCIVTRKSDGVSGSLDFTNAFGPRFYFGFVPDKSRG